MAVFCQIGHVATSVDTSVIVGDHAWEETVRSAARRSFMSEEPSARRAGAAVVLDIDRAGRDYACAEVPIGSVENPIEENRKFIMAFRDLSPRKQTEYLKTVTSAKSTPVRLTGRLTAFA
jgi:hypothetical protein